MDTRRRWRTAVLGLFMALLPAVLGDTLTPPPAHARQTAPTSLTIVARLCPLSYADDEYAADCAAPLDGVTFHAGDVRGEPPTGVTDSRGVVTFPGFAAPPFPRRVVIDEDVPGDFVHVFAACGDLAGSPLEVKNDGQTAELLVAEGASVVCNWYVMPEDRRTDVATLTIHNRICPEGFTGPDYYGACHDTPAPAGLDFIAVPLGSDDGTEATTDAMGNARFSVPPGEYTVRGGVPGDFARLAVFCAPAASPGTRFPTTILGGGVRGPDDPTGIRITLASGDNVVCDWYNTPESQRGDPVPTLAPAPIASAARPDGFMGPI